MPSGGSPDVVQVILGHIADQHIGHKIDAIRIDSINLVWDKLPIALAAAM